MTRSLALLDVDHTLLFDNDKLNTSLLDSLMEMGIRDIYLFTDMNISSSGLRDRQRLIQKLNERGFAVHGVITPLDLLWQIIPGDQTTQFMEYIATQPKWTGEEFESFLSSADTLEKFPFLAERTKIEPKDMKPGVAYEEAIQRVDEVEEGQAMPDHLNQKGQVAKIFGDQWALNRGYRHTKGLLLEAFLQNKPEWVSSIVVGDDNTNVIESIEQVKEQLPNNKTFVTSITVTKKDEERQVYSSQIVEHMKHDSNPPPPQVFLFDRDSTLLDKDEKIINEEPILDYLSYLTQNKVPIGIVSSGSIDFNDDPAIKAIRSYGLDLSRENIAYPTMSRSIANLILNRSPSNFQGVTRIEGGSPADFPFAEIIAQGVVDNTTSPTKIQFRNNKIDSSIEITPESTFDIKLGKTTITLNIMAFMSSFELLSTSDCKIYQTILALDELGYELQVNDQLKNLGIVSIKRDAPSSKPILASQVVFMDDKPSIYHAMKTAGFQPILATTPEAINSKEHDARYEEHRTQYPEDDISENSYLTKFSNMIKAHSQANPGLKKQGGVLLVEGAIDHNNAAKSIKEILNLSEASMKKTVFIFPGNSSHHHPKTTLYSIKSGSGMATVAQKLGQEGYPVLSLPTKGMEQWKDSYTQQAIVQNAICDLWRAVGAGYNLALPVREHSHQDYFSDSIDVMGKQFEPSFWGGVLKDANPELACHYMKQIKLLQKVSGMTLEERNEYFKQQTSESTKDPDWNPEFLRAYVSGESKTKNDAWYQEKPHYDLHSALNEIRVKEAKLRDELKNNPGSAHNQELLNDKIEALQEVSTGVNDEYFKFNKKEAPYNQDGNSQALFKKNAVELINQVEKKHTKISEHRNILSHLFSKLINAIAGLFSEKTFFKAETSSLFITFKDKLKQEANQEQDQDHSNQLKR